MNLGPLALESTALPTELSRLDGLSVEIRAILRINSKIPKNIKIFQDLLRFVKIFFKVFQDFYRFIEIFLDVLRFFKEFLKVTPFS